MVRKYQGHCGVNGKPFETILASVMHPTVFKPALHRYVANSETKFTINWANDARISFKTQNLFQMQEKYNNNNCD